MNKFKKGLKVNTEARSSTKDNYYIMYDENKKKIGTINQDSEKLQSQWLKGVSVFIITPDGNLILEQRAKKTKLTPNQIDLCSGHRDNEEKGKTTPYRELKEELGLKKKKMLKLKKVKKEVPLVFKGERKFFIQFYATMLKKKNSKIKLQEEELESIIEVPLQDGFDMIRKGETKFPYEGKEEEFEEIFKKVAEYYQKNRKQEEKQNDSNDIGCDR